jgi:hypothetical protein
VTWAASRWGQPRQHTPRYDRFVARGYLDGPATEERLDALDRRDQVEEDRPRERRAVYGSTDDDLDKHFIGWLDEVDPNELFASGKAWGLSVVLRCE